jgi:uncharacterized protein
MRSSLRMSSALRAFSIAWLVGCGGAPPTVVPGKPSSPTTVAKPISTPAATTSAPVIPLLSTSTDCTNVSGNSEAINAFDKACAGNESHGCVELAMRYTCGSGVARDIAKAAHLNDRACALGLAVACGNAAMGLIAPEVNDPARAYTDAEKGCGGHDASSCGDLALFLWQGIGVVADPARAAKMFDAQCKSWLMMSCANQAVQLYLGIDVPRDVERAKLLGEKSCRAGMEAGCNVYGGILVDAGGASNLDRAIELFDKICRADNGSACANLGQVYARKQPPDLEHAKAALKKACDLGNAVGCTQLGELLSR